MCSYFFKVCSSTLEAWIFVWPLESSSNAVVVTKGLFEMGGEKVQVRFEKAVSTVALNNDLGCLPNAWLTGSP